MCQLSAAVLQPPHLAEVLPMVVEAHASRRLGIGVVRDQQLEFECLLNLAYRHDLADPTEEWIIGDINRVRQRPFLGQLPCTLHPAFPESSDLFGPTDADELPHAERLKAIQRA